MIFIMDHFNKLTPAEHERLTILFEEMAEAIHAVGKILRHGYEDSNPNTGVVNRGNLERELGDVRCAMIMLCEAGDVSKEKIHDLARLKRERIGKYLHHQ